MKRKYSTSDIQKFKGSKSWTVLCSLFNEHFFNVHWPFLVQFYKSQQAIGNGQRAGKFSSRAEGYENGSLGNPLTIEPNKKRYMVHLW